MNVYFEIDIDTSSLTPLSKLLMGKPLSIATENITSKQFEILSDRFIMETLNISLSELVHSIIGHKKVNDSEIVNILNLWVGYDKWDEMFGVEYNSSISNDEYFKQYPEIRDYYKLKYKLIMEFKATTSTWNKAVWHTPQHMSDDMIGDIKKLLKYTTPQDLVDYITTNYRFKTGEQLIDKFKDLYINDEKFSNHIKLTNPDLSEALREIL